MLDFLSQGFLYKEIAEKMGISYETVHTYIRRIYEKLQVRTRTEAVAKFLKRSPAVVRIRPDSHSPRWPSARKNYRPFSL